MFSSRVRGLARLSAVRLTLSLLLVFSSIAALAGAGAYWLVRHEMTRLADARLAAQMASTISALEAGAPAPPPGFNQSVVVLREDGARRTLPFPLPDGLADGVYLHDPNGPEHRYLIHTLADGARIVVSENLERQDELLDALSGGLQASLLGVVLVGGLAGFWFAARAQSRLDLISDGLAQVAQGRLDTRIDLPGPADDLGVLAARINATTARLEYSVEQMRVQSSNIAHDLRTPLARLRAGVETSLIDLVEKQRPVDADALGSALEQIDRIIGAFNALLRLSRIESGAGREAFATVDLGALVEHVADTYAPVAEDAGQRLKTTIAAPARILGDWDLLMQAAANLIQNAMRHGAAEQKIALRVEGAALSVADQGAGVPAGERSKVLQPLYQLDAARRSDGFGLGLSMVATIAKLHGASLDLSEGPDGRGLMVTLQFPEHTEL